MLYPCLFQRLKEDLSVCIRCCLVKHVFFHLFNSLALCLAGKLWADFRLRIL
jgi:hypothetical protein